jgi:hypothetical protein
VNFGNPPGSSKLTLGITSESRTGSIPTAGVKDEMPLIAPREAATVQLPSLSNQKPGSPWKLMVVEEFFRVLPPQTL